MEHGGLAELDMNSFRIDEDSEKKQLEGGGDDTEVRGEVRAMEVEHDEMEKELEGSNREAGLESTATFSQGPRQCPQNSKTGRVINDHDTDKTKGIEREVQSVV